jgi:PTS system nitrogen regulatory IIA component
MNPADLIMREDVLVDVRAASKKRVMAELAAHAARRLGIAPDILLEALMRREELGSTGVGEGIAIPHARLDQIQRPYGIFARLRSGIAFDAVDDQPVDLIVLLLLPTVGPGAQLNALACIARALRDTEIASALRKVRDPQDAHDLLSRHHHQR